jgi:hypothetical protein
MGTCRSANETLDSVFHGLASAHRTPKSLGANSHLKALSPDKPIPGLPNSQKEGIGSVGSEMDNP